MQEIKNGIDRTHLNNFHIKLFSNIIFYYFAIRSSHFNINNIVHIDNKQTATKTIHVNHIDIDSYKTAPINNNWFPIAVAPNQPPCITP